MEVIDTYIEQQPDEVQPVLKQLRQTLLAALPNAEERFTYNMPTLWQGGGVIQFKVNRDHLAIYPGPETMAAFADRFGDYVTTQAGVQVPWDDELPYDLIVELARHSLGVVQEGDDEERRGTGDAY